MAENSRHESGLGTRAGGPAGYTAPAGADEAPTYADDGAAVTAAAFEAVAVAVALLDADGRVRSVNAQARQLLGLDREVAGGLLLPRRWPGSLHDEEGRHIDPAGWPLASLPAGGREAASRLFRVRHPGRPSPAWVHVTAEPLREAGAGHGTVVVTLADATALAETRAELEDVVADRATLLEAVPDMFIYVGTDDRVTRVVGERKGAGLDARRSQVPAVGSRTWELFKGEAAGKARQALALARATGRPVTTEPLTRDALRYAVRGGPPRAARRRRAPGHAARHHGTQAYRGRAGPQRGEVPDALHPHAGDAALHRRRGAPCGGERPLA